MTPPIVRKVFLCPVIGQGTREDPHRPLISAVVKRTSMIMRRLKTDPEMCVCIVQGPVDEVNKLNTQLDVHLVATVQSVKGLRLSDQAKHEISAWWPVGEKCRIHLPRRRKIKR